MLYKFGYALMWMTLRIFFRKVLIDGKERLSSSHPTIIIANHPGSFLDAMVLSVFFGRPLYFYVRGDIFAHPIIYKIFTGLHMIPIYSIDSGVESLGKNKRTFERGRELLRAGNVLLIFPEGFSRFSKELAPFKKGAARVALQTAFEDQFDKVLQIQTVSINYSYHGFRSILHVRIGDAMELDGYRDSYLSQPNHAIAALNRDMFELFEKNVIHVKQSERTPLVESLLQIAVDGESDADLYFKQSRKLCEKISAMNEENFKLEEERLLKYQDMLKQHKVSSNSIHANQPFYFFKIIFLVLATPLALIGFMLWHVIYFITKWIADYTVTREDFYTSVFCGVAGILGFIWWIMLSSFALFSDAVPVFFIAIFSPFIYMFSLYWMEMLGEILAFNRVRRLKLRDTPNYQKLLDAKAALN